MLILAAVLLAVAVVPLTGGDLRRLGRLRWRAPWLIVLALLTQVVVLELPGLPESAAAAVHVATYGLAAGFVWANRRVRGLVLLGLGAAANGVTIALNGGTLPSTAAARRIAGLEAGDGFANSAIVEDPVLGFLGDNFAVPAWFPLANVFSIGDVLIVAGAVWVLFSVTAKPRGPRQEQAGDPADGSAGGGPAVPAAVAPTSPAPAEPGGESVAVEVPEQARRPHRAPAGRPR